MSKSAYRVRVEVTNASANAFRAAGYYYDCEKGEVIVIASDIAEVSRILDEAHICSIERIGVGYTTLKDS